MDIDDFFFPVRLSFKSRLIASAILSISIKTGKDEAGQRCADDGQGSKGKPFWETTSNRCLCRDRETPMASLIVARSSGPIFKPHGDSREQKGNKHALT